MDIQFHTTGRSPYLWAGALTPVLAGLLFWRHGFSTAACLYVFFTLLLLVLSAIDCEQMILPDVLTFPGAVLAAGSSFLLGMPFQEMLAGAALGYGSLQLLAVCFPNHLGQGDAKLMLLIGALCGIRPLSEIIGIASVFALAFALLTHRQRVPFGPFLSFGAFGQMLWGEVA